MKKSATPIQSEIRDIASHIIGARPTISDKIISGGRKFKWMGDASNIQHHAKMTSLQLLLSKYSNVKVSAQDTTDFLGNSGYKNIIIHIHETK